MHFQFSQVAHIQAFEASGFWSSQTQQSFLIFRYLSFFSSSSTHSCSPLLFQTKFTFFFIHLWHCYNITSRKKKRNRWLINHFHLIFPPVLRSSLLFFIHRNLIFAGKLICKAISFLCLHRCTIQIYYTSIHQWAHWLISTCCWFILLFFYYSLVILKTVNFHTQ